MNSRTAWRSIFAGIVILTIGCLFYYGRTIWSYVQPTPEVDRITQTNDEIDFEHYPQHDVPADASIIDQYFYVRDGEVFLNSVTATSSSLLPNIDGDTFKRLSDFVSHPDPAIAVHCGAVGSYAYYTDQKQVYFYQIWLTPKFKKSKMEGIIGVTPDTFSIVDTTTFLGDGKNYTIDYMKSTSTCMYILKPS